MMSAHFFLIRHTPLHGLLLSRASGPLVMTSGNLADEPIAADENELVRVLGKIADMALVHNRPIVRRCDDSVLRFAAGRRVFIRRSRGYVPDRIGLPSGGPSVLGCGGDLKNTFCITRNSMAFVSQHIGDLDDPRSMDFYRDAISDKRGGNTGQTPCTRRLWIIWN